MAYDPAAIGQTVRRLRVAAEMSQQDLGDAIGMAQSNVTRIERGDGNQTVENLSDIADFFGVKVGSLIDGEVESAGVPQVQITRAVACRDCGVIAVDIGTDAAKKIRADHIREHARGER